MKVQVKQYLHYATDAWQKAQPWVVYGCNMEKHGGCIFVEQINTEIEVPDNFDPVSRQVAVLDEQERFLRAEFAKKLMEIAGEKSKLLCITNEVEA